MKWVHAILFTSTGLGLGFLGSRYGGVDGDGRSPQAAAKSVSQIPVPAEVPVLQFEERWSEFNGDGFMYIELDLSDSEFERLVATAMSRGYRNGLPRAISSNRLMESLGGNADPIYRYNIDSTGYQLAVIDRHTKRILIYVVSQ